LDVVVVVVVMVEAEIELVVEDRVVYPQEGKHRPPLSTICQDGES
jgi:hypothetical protein